MKAFSRVCLTALVISCAIGSSVVGQAKSDNPAANPMPRNKGWIKRHEGFVEIAKKGGVDVLFLGDSITDAWRGGAARPTWKKHFEPMNAANFGISGDQTQHVLWRLQNGELNGIAPKVAVLMIGTNNVPRNHTPKQIAAGVTAIVDTIHEKSPKTKILLLAIFPRDASPKSPRRMTINKTNMILAKLDKRDYVRYMDIGQEFLQKDGTLTKDIMPDLLHLSAEGYRIWGEAIAPTVREMVRKND